jgi:hypothetical protein
VRGTHDCDAAAACANAPGGFTCRCFPGYAGEGGTKCTPTPELAKLVGRYVTQGAAKLACEEGEDLQYPRDAPGYMDDPTGGLSKAVGSNQKVRAATPVPLAGPYSSRPAAAAPAPHACTAGRDPPPPHTHTHRLGR